MLSVPGLQVGHVVGVTLVQVVRRVGGGGGVGRGRGAAAKGRVHLILLCYLMH